MTLLPCSQSAMVCSCKTFLYKLSHHAPCKHYFGHVWYCQRLLNILNRSTGLPSWVPFLIYLICVLPLSVKAGLKTVSLSLSSRIAEIFARWRQKLFFISWNSKDRQEGAKLGINTFLLIERGGEGEGNQTESSCASAEA